MEKKKSNRFMVVAISVIMVLFAGFQLYTTAFGLLPEIQQRAVHLGFVIALAFILYPSSKRFKALRILDTFLGVGGVASMVYLTVNYDNIVNRSGIANNVDIFFGVVALLVVLEGTRRTTGNALPILSLLFLAFAMFGSAFPGILAHPDFSIFRIVEHLYLSLEGIFGVALAVSATFLYLFVLFGAVLGETGASDLFCDVGMAVAGTRVGGQAKVAVLSSSLMGMVSGSSPANAATMGSFTIPLMKNAGYEPEFAAAVEAVASTGGQIMPPVMGVAAFIMAQFLGISYFDIALSAVIPALLYYVATWYQIHFHSARIGLMGLDRSQLPNVKKVLRERGHLFIPLLFIIYMIVAGYTPLYSAFFAIILTIAVSYLKKETRFTPKMLLNAIVTTAKNVVPISLATATVGIIIGVFSLTGTALLIGNSIISLAGGSLLLVLVFTMLVSLILGMGLPTSAVYIMAATFAAPAMVKMGVPQLVAHFFVFYYGCLSAITPPVALAAFVTAGIAGASVNKVGWLAARLAIAGFIVPFMFVYEPALLLVNSSVVSIIVAVITSTAGVIFLSAAIEGFLFTGLKKVERFVLLVASLLLIYPGLATSALGLTLVACIIFLNLRSKSRMEGIIH